MHTTSRFALWVFIVVASCSAPALGGTVNPGADSATIVSRLLDGISQRDARMANFIYAATETLTSSQGGSSTRPAQRYVNFKFRVVRLNDKIGLDYTWYDETSGQLAERRSAWNKDMLRVLSRDNVKVDGEASRTDVSGVIADAQPGQMSMGLTSFRVNELLGLRVLDGYRELKTEGRTNLIETPTTLAQYLRTCQQRLGSKYVVKEVSEQGHQLLEASFPSPYFENKTESYWFDEARDYLPVRHEANITKSQGLPNQTVQDVVDAKQVDGFWLPRKIILKFNAQADAVASSTEEYDFTELQLGKAKDSDLEVDFPVGATVIDYITQAAYEIVDQNTVKAAAFTTNADPIIATPQLIAKSIAEHPPFPNFKPSNIGALDVTPEAAATVTHSEKSYWWQLIGFVSVIGGAGLLLRTYKRRRRAR